MPSDRFFTNEALAKGGEILIEDLEFHHLTNVMRLKAGEEIELVNGKGALACCTITAVEKKRARIHVDEVNIQKAPDYEIILAQAMPRQNRLDFILEKGTELGMTQLWLFPAQHSDRKDITEHQLERFATTTIAAMKQCGRLFLPKLVIKPPLNKRSPLDYKLFFGDVSSNVNSLRDMWKRENEKGIVFFIGPESGFSEKEHALLKDLKATGVKLHPNILRTDTAAIVALSHISQQLY